MWLGYNTGLRFTTHQTLSRLATLPKTEQHLAAVPKGRPHYIDLHVWCNNFNLCRTWSSSNAPYNFTANFQGENQNKLWINTKFLIWWQLHQRREQEQCSGVDSHKWLTLIRQISCYTGSGTEVLIPRPVVAKLWHNNATMVCIYTQLDPFSFTVGEMQVTVIILSWIHTVKALRGLGQQLLTQSESRKINNGMHICHQGSSITVC